MLRIYPLTKQGLADQLKDVKECPYCNNTGIMYVQNGTDDIDAELCVCQLGEDK